MRELAHRGAAGLAQVIQIQLAAQREQQRVRIRRPLVIDNAGEGRDALALAAGFFGIAQGLGARQQHLGIHQQPGLATGDVVFPQVQLVAVAVLTAQEGHPRTIGRDLGLHQRRARQRQRAGDGLQSEFFGVGGGDSAEHEGKGGEQGAH